MMRNDFGTQREMVITTLEAVVASAGRDAGYEGAAEKHRRLTSRITGWDGPLPTSAEPRGQG